MSVVKSLALGASILGSMVAPTLAGSLRTSYHVPDRPNSSGTSGMPTTLVMAPASTSRSVVVGEENLANPGGSQPAQTFLSALSSVVPASGNTATLGTSSGNLFGSAAPTASVPISYTAPAPAATSISSTPTVAAAAAAATAGHTIDAFINFGNAPYSEAQTLTTGNPQSWTQSPVVQAVYGGTPTAVQQTAFKNEVLQTIQSTYNQSGLNISLTTDPTQNYAHTESVVSGASYSGNSSAIGITDVGNDGFSFIDKFGQAKSADELAMAIGHNIAHELMHAFGIAIHPDQTGTYLDAASASWSLLTSSSTTFSPAAVQLLSAQNFLNGPGKEFTSGALGVSGLELLTEHHPKFCNCPLCRALRALKAAEGISVNASPVPEPTTIALWGVAGVAGVVVRRRSRARVA